MVICLPVSRSYCVFMSSSVFFKLAAANTTRSRGCCAMPGPVGRSHALAARPTIAPSSDRRRARYDAICYAGSAFPAGTAISYRIDGPRAVGKGFAQRRTCRRFHRDLSKEMPHEARSRNQLKGKIVAVTKGQTTAHVRIDIGGGVIVTSSITNEAVDDLALNGGDTATAVIKASDRMIGK